MKLSEIINVLEQWAPLSFQEEYDNSGLIVGQNDLKINKAIISLDCTEEVVNEAIDMDANLIISHHPIVFRGLKKFNGKTYVERTVMKAIKHDIALYAIHTNLDNTLIGVNAKIAEKIDIQNTRILAPKKNQLKKLIFFVPITQSEAVCDALFMAGAGSIGDYDRCSFQSLGKGTFRANEKAKPYVGETGEWHKEEEMRVEMIYPKFKERKVLSALLHSHPYEEVAYDLYDLSNTWNQMGSGFVGELREEMEVGQFLEKLKTDLNTPCIRYTDYKKKIKKVAICGGSGSFLLSQAKRENCDVFITGDFKYHEFFDAEGQIMIADVGHYESEQFTMQLIQDFLKEKIPNFATYLTKRKTNPINYI